MPKTDKEEREEEWVQEIIRNLPLTSESERQVYKEAEQVGRATAKLAGIAVLQDVEIEYDEDGNKKYHCYFSNGTDSYLG